MDGAWGPSRLRVIDLCQQASGTVTFVEKWSDGDWNIYVDLDPSSEGLVSNESIKKLREWPQARGGAQMLWEIIPDDQPELPPPSEGQRVNVVGAYVYDRNWGYREIHPIYQETIDGTTRTRPPH